MNEEIIEKLSKRIILQFIVLGTKFNKGNTSKARTVFIFIVACQLKNIDLSVFISLKIKNSRVLFITLPRPAFISSYKLYLNFFLPFNFGSSVNISTSRTCKWILKIKSHNQARFGSLK